MDDPSIFVKGKGGGFALTLNKKISPRVHGKPKK
jgi:hypothetical protein